MLTVSSLFCAWIHELGFTFVTKTPTQLFSLPQSENK